MTMLTNRHTRVIKFECDICADILDSQSTDLREALNVLSDEGWMDLKVNSIWRHVCSQRECTLGAVKKQYGN